MKYDLNSLRKHGLMVEEGISFTGNEERYVAAIQRYLKGYEKNKRDMISMLEAGDLEDYRIRVHSLKSNSKMIGASELSKKFSDLESAAESKDVEYIRSIAPRVLTAYDELITFLAPFGKMEEVHPAGELTAEEAAETVVRLLDALDEFDDELSAKLAVKLLGYPFRITQKEKLRNAIRYIDDFMYDEAAELIQDISPSIE